MPKNNPYLAAMCCETQNVNPLFNFIGAKLTFIEKGSAKIDLPVTPCLTQGAGVLAGGILATLADEAMAHAVISMLEPTTTTVTTEMNIRFLRATDPKKGGRLTATARVVKPGRQVMTTEAEIHDDAGRLLATAGGSFLLVPKDQQ